MNKDVILNLVGSCAEFRSHCPRCGGVLEPAVDERALSRYADVSICSRCGTDEALCAYAAGENKAHFEQWAVYKELLESLISHEGRARFVDIMDSSIYSGVNFDNEPVLVFVEKGVGMDIKTIHAGKPNWYEVVSYDQYGYSTSVTYEPTGVSDK